MQPVATVVPCAVCLNTLDLEPNIGGPAQDTAFKDDRDSALLIVLPPLQFIRLTNLDRSKSRVQFSDARGNNIGVRKAMFGGCSKNCGYVMHAFG